MKKSHCRRSEVGGCVVVEPLESRQLLSMTLPSQELRSPELVSPVVVTPISPVVLHSEAIHAIAGESFTAVVGTVSLPSTTVSTLPIAASIQWGDGTAATPGKLVPTTGGTLAIEGTHTYADVSTTTGSTTAAATRAITVTVVRSQPVSTVGSAVSATMLLGTIHSTASVLPYDGGTTSTEVAGSTFNASLGTFSSTLPTTGTFTATISWGDGVTTTGRVVAVASTASATSTRYEVLGTHSYATFASYAVHISVTWTPGGTSTGSTGALPPVIVNVAQIDSVIDSLPNSGVLNAT